jgi:hypothetical protein
MLRQCVHSNKLTATITSKGSFEVQLTHVLWKVLKTLELLAAAQALPLLTCVNCDYKEQFTYDSVWGNQEIHLPASVRAPFRPPQSVSSFFLYSMWLISHWNAYIRINIQSLSSAIQFSSTALELRYLPPTKNLQTFLVHFLPSHCIAHLYQTLFFRFVRIE